MQGRIIKGIAGFYYVYTEEAGIFECKAKGAFRKEKIKPLVGDLVCIDLLDPIEKKGNLTEILPRKNQLIRPAVSNIDMALVIFACAKPEPNFNLLDRFLCMMEYRKIPVTICFNKSDLADEKDRQAIADIYRASGYPLLFVSAAKEEGFTQVRDAIRGKTVTVAGPSGVGKSSCVNLLQQGVCMETGEISQKIDRGKNTTRHAELIPVEAGTFIVDTPGFSSMDLPPVTKEEVRDFYPEFLPFADSCFYLDCSHINEPDCGVKEALKDGKIHPLRYENYKLLYRELKNIKKY